MIMKQIRVGDTIPTICVAQRGTSDPFSVSYPTTNHTLIIFMRGTWCLYCRKQLNVLGEYEAALRQAGITIICISTEHQARLDWYVDQNKLPFQLYSDQSRAASKAFGVHYWLSYDGFNLAHPALFLADPNGKAMIAHVSKSMNDLPIGHLLEVFVGFLNAPATTSDSVLPRIHS